MFNSRLIVLLHVYLAAIFYVTAREFNSFRYESSKVSSAFRRITAPRGESTSCISRRRDWRPIGLSSTCVHFSLERSRIAAFDLRAAAYDRRDEGRGIFFKSRAMELWRARENLYIFFFFLIKLQYNLLVR